MALPRASDMEILGSGMPTGTSVGADSSELVGFHGSAADQAAFVSDQSIIALSVSGVVGFTSSTSLSSLVGKVNSILALLVEKGLMASS